MRVKLLLELIFVTLFLLGCSLSDSVNQEPDNKNYIEEVSITETIKENHTISKDIRFPILMYHTVVENSPNSTGNTQPKVFKEHMEHIQKAGFNTISPFELVDFMEGKGDLPSNPILITFDDGYKDNYTYAYPILKNLNMKATIFTITSRIHNAGENPYPNELEKITWEDIEDMKDLITIQNHTWNMHYQVDEKPRLITPEKNQTYQEHLLSVQKDLELAQNTIFEKLGYKSVMLAYPYGGYNKDTIEIIKNTEINFAVTTKSAINTKEYLIESPYELYRITGDGRLTGEELVEKIESYKK